MDNTNIFYHSPKELTTDAFWVWLLYFVDSEDKYKETKQILFDALILKDSDRGRQVHKISVDRQKSCHHGRIDFLLTFTFIDDNSEHSVLFEDKTWSTTTQAQLNGYKSDYPDLYRYLYYKLAYIRLAESKLVTDCGYDIINSKMMVDCLSRFTDIHILIKYYYEYIKATFSDYIDSLDKSLLKDCNYDLLWDAQAQFYLADKLWQLLPDDNKDGMYIQFGTSSGRPWTEIVISEDNPIIPGYNESIFWRIDIRSGRFYLRLNQYCSYKDDEQGTITRKKRERLDRLRVYSDDILKDSKLHLQKGVPSDRGLYEQEIVIFFLDENPWQTIFHDFPIYTSKFLELYSKSF